MKSVEDVEQSIRKLTVESGDQIHDRVLGKLVKRLDASKGQVSGEQVHVRRVITIGRVGKLAAACLIVGSCVACFVLSKRVNDLEAELEHAQAQAQAQRDVVVAQTESPDDSATINLYLKEHEDAVARHASLDSAAPPPVQMRLSPDEIIYYEFYGSEPGNMGPGIIVKGPSSEQEVSSPDGSAISNGHVLSLSEARESAGFNLVARPWLHPGYKLDEIRRVDGRDALQLIYTDGINSVSLFEQPLDGQRGLSRQDFREYAVYRNKEEGGGTILAWRDDEVSYVLIGKAEMSQLMDMAQSISAGR